MAEHEVCEASGKPCLTFTEAEHAAARQRRKKGRPVQAYKCRDCRAWHTGQRTV